MLEPTGRFIDVTIRRWSGRAAEAPHYATYRIPFTEGMSVSGALQLVNELYDGGVAHYLSCRRGLCAGCVVKVNGKPCKGCIETVTGPLVLEPVAPHRVIKDLVHDY